MSILPDDVLHYNVLTRLPVKSLLRFKSVCKYWYSLINSSTFLDICRKYTIESRDYYSNNDLLIAYQKKSFIFIKNRGQFFTYLYAPQFSRGIFFELDNEIEISGDVDACCGVICVRMENGFALCNPITRECHKIILVEPQMNFHTHGFGCDSVSADYKIILIFPILDGNFKLGVTQIYSTRTNLWKQGNKICSSIIYIQYKGRCEVNNALHYICLKKTVIGKKLSIFTIDLHTEKFNTMELPIKLTTKYADMCKLIASNGRLYLRMNKFKSLHATTIWVMKEYGVVESWTKLYELEGDIVKSRIVSYKLSKEGGEILVLRNKSTIDKTFDELMWYNLEDKSFRKVDVLGNKRDYYYQFVCMKCSLAPILGSTALTQANV